MAPIYYWAHSAPHSAPDSDSRAGWQLLNVHLEAVARMAHDLASAARPIDRNLARLAHLSGLMHDFGKYSDCFQKMLLTGQGRCQHAIHGAMLAYFGTEEAANKPRLNTVMAAIAGHHAGLSDWSDFSAKLTEELYRREARQIRARAIADCPELRSVVSDLDTRYLRPDILARIARSQRAKRLGDLTLIGEFRPSCP